MYHRHRYRLKEFVVVFGFIPKFLLVAVGELGVGGNECFHERLFRFLLSRWAQCIDRRRRMGINGDLFLLKVLPDTADERFEGFGLVIYMRD